MKFPVSMCGYERTLEQHETRWACLGACSMVWLWNVNTMTDLFDFQDKVSLTIFRFHRALFFGIPQSTMLFLIFRLSL